MITYLINISKLSFSEIKKNVYYSKMVIEIKKRTILDSEKILM